MNHNELKKAYLSDELAFRGALIALFHHGADTLKNSKVTESFQPTDGTLIAPELQKDMIALAHHLANTEFTTLMYFLKTEVSFCFPCHRASPVDEEGHCPVCGSEIQYCGSHDMDDSGCTIPWKCTSCGASGNEGYTCCFDRHYKVCSANGELFPGRELGSETEVE